MLSPKQLQHLNRVSIDKDKRFREYQEIEQELKEILKEGWPIDIDARFPHLIHDYIEKNRRRNG